MNKPIIFYPFFKVQKDKTFYNDDYRLQVNIEFVKRLTRTERSWVNPLANYLEDIKYNRLGICFN